jgi:DNA repair exonuclease SbcCD ATPase subunit
MYQPRSLELINFGSHTHTKFDFPNSQTTLLTGVNETNEGQKSNGSGKSFILEGLSYALLGSSLRKVKDKELVQDANTKATIVLVMENKVTNYSLSITRHIYSNTKSGELIIEGENNITSVNEGNQFILDKLGLTRDDILNYFLLSKERYTSFFSSSDTAKKELINRFSKADQIQIPIDSCDDDIKHYQSEVNSYQRDIDTNKARLEGFQEVDNTEMIFSIKKENESLREAINLLEIEIANQEYFLTPTKEVIDELKDASKSHEPKIREISDLLEEYERTKADIDKHLRSSVECPNCQHTFSLKDDKYSLSEAKEMYPVIEESIKDLIVERKLAKEDQQKVEIDLRTYRGDLQELELKIRNLNNEKANHSRMIANNDKRIEILSKPITNKSAEIELNISALEGMLRKSQENLSLATEWKLRFVRFKGYLANRSLSNIQSHSNFYLQKLGSDLTVEITGFTLVNNGKEIREKINTVVYRNGSEASFSRFSGGERARIEIAIILAMQRIINQSSGNNGLDLICIDEILESLDSLGIELIVKALNKLQLNVLFISQLGMEANYEHTLVVKKINGESEIFFN